MWTAATMALGRCGRQQQWQSHEVCHGVVSKGRLGSARSGASGMNRRAVRGREAHHARCRGCVDTACPSPHPPATCTRSPVQMARRRRSGASTQPWHTSWRRCAGAQRLPSHAVGLSTNYMLRSCGCSNRKLSRCEQLTLHVSHATFASMPQPVFSRGTPCPGRRRLFVGSDWSEWPAPCCPGPRTPAASTFPGGPVAVAGRQSAGGRS